ncbi:MAG TPA: 5-(carboxyamino)imidazole ribonucleotide mutase [Gemmatimonadaceae bacterium]|nr:5-(carboxyamino)imidazole ribonucleotide mutase [Gemmatimonadaceae bacterium]
MSPSPKRPARKPAAKKKPAAAKSAKKSPAKPAKKAVAAKRPAAKTAPASPPRSLPPLPRPSRAPAARPAPLVGIILGSRTDLDTLASGTELLDAFGIPYEMRILSAHRTPDETAAWAKGAEGRGLEVIIAAAGLAAHLPGVVAAQTVLPVLGVPVEGGALNGLDALLSIVQMPKGVPVGTLAIGKHGAANAALLAAAILAAKRPELRDKLRSWRAARVAEALAQS